MHRSTFNTCCSLTSRRRTSCRFRSNFFNVRNTSGPYISSRNFIKPVSKWYPYGQHVHRNSVMLVSRSLTPDSDVVSKQTNRKWLVKWYKSKRIFLVFNRSHLVFLCPIFLSLLFISKQTRESNVRTIMHKIDRWNLWFEYTFINMTVYVYIFLPPRSHNRQIIER